MASLRMPMSRCTRSRSERGVGQDGILRAGWQPAPGGNFANAGRRVTNPPQVANLPYQAAPPGAAHCLPEKSQ
jgi:hypothetical protein